MPRNQAVATNVTKAIQLFQLDSVTPEEPLGEQRRMAAEGHAPALPFGS